MSGAPGKDWALLGAHLALVLVDLLVLARSLRSKVRPEIAAERFLLGAYLPPALVMVFAVFPIERERLLSGAAMVAIACVCYLATTALLFRRPFATA